MGAPKGKRPAISIETAKSTDTTGPGTDNGPVDPNLELQERIRCRAYQLYCQRGGSSGNDVNDWLQAEAEVTGKASSANVEQKVGEVVEQKKAAA